MNILPDCGQQNHQMNALEHLRKICELSIKEMSSTKLESSRIDEIRQLMKYCPFTVDVHSTLIRRLRISSRFLKSGEKQAAIFEMRMAVGQILAGGCRLSKKGD